MHGRGPAPSLWGHRDFMLFWGGQSVGLIGSQVNVVALPLVALRALERDQHRAVW